MQDVGLNSLLNQYISNTFNKVYTALACKVTDNSQIGQQRISVQPITNKVTPDGESLEQPVLQSVPLIFPGSSSSQFTFPVAVGDVVLCVFSQRTLDSFKLGSKDLHKPKNLRKFSRNDAVAIPGLFPFSEAPNNPSQRSLSHSTDDAVVTHNIGSGSECEVRLQASGGVVVNSSSTVEVNCQNAQVNADENVTVDTPETFFTGDVFVEGKVAAEKDVTANNGISLTYHTHGGVKGGSSNTMPPN